MLGPLMQRKPPYYKKITKKELEHVALSKKSLSRDFVSGVT
jgi:hypothetical protein